MAKALKELKPVVIKILSYYEHNKIFYYNIFCFTISSCITTKKKYTNLVNDDKIYEFINERINNLNSNELLYNETINDLIINEEPILTSSFLDYNFNKRVTKRTDVDTIFTKEDIDFFVFQNQTKIELKESNLIKKEVLFDTIINTFSFESEDENIYHYYSKPLFTLNGKYCLFFIKSKAKYGGNRSIWIYEKKDGKWEVIDSITNL